MLTASLSFGQAGMTADSVKVPLRWLKKATIELNQFDDCKQELKLTNKAYSDCKMTFEALKKENKLLLGRVAEMDQRFSEKGRISDFVDSTNQNTIEGLNKSLKREKFKRKTNFVYGTMAGLFVGVVLHSVIKH